MYIPNDAGIIKESTYGYHLIPIQDEMLSHREVELVGEVTPEAMNALVRQLRYLQRQDPEGPITLYINSPGGSVDSGMALYDVMQAVSCPIRTICVGLAASMAALLFISGGQRDMLPHSRLMIHDPLILQTGESLIVADTKGNLRRLYGKYLEAILLFILNQLPQERHSLYEAYTFLSRMEALDDIITEEVINHPNSAFVRKIWMIQQNKAADKMDASINGILARHLDVLANSATRRMFQMERPQKEAEANLEEERAI